MTALALGAYVLGIAHFAPKLLVGRAWIARSSRLAMWVWISLICSTLLALTLSALASAVALLPADWALFAVLRACTELGGRQAAFPESVLGAALGIGGLGLALVRVCLAFRATRRRSRSEGAQQRAALSLVASKDGQAGFLVLDHPDPSAFCLAGPRPTVVVTSGALTRLTGAQLQGVLAHERAHLRGRHHLVLGLTESLRSGLPWLRVFAMAHAQLGDILEMRADDIASRTCGRHDLACALLTMASSRTPSGALAVASCATSERVRRLAEPPASRARTLARTALGGLLLAGAWPVLLTTWCAVAALTVHVCVATGLV